MKAGIVGLPNVGKSSLFNCLSKAKAQSENFPFCTIEPNVGVISVPDNRLESISKLVINQFIFLIEFRNWCVDWLKYPMDS